MSEYKPEFLAKEAERLEKDVVLIHALEILREEALDELVNCDATDTAKVIKYQQQADMAHEVMRQLKRFRIAIGDVE